MGQALLEAGVYDDASGQLLAGSFMDYAMPRADDLPLLGSALHPAPCRSNALGVKGVDEAGTTASLAAVMNAVADATVRTWRAITTSDLGRKDPSPRPSPREAGRGKDRVAGG